MAVPALPSSSPPSAARRYLDVALASLVPQAARRGRRGRSSSTTGPTRRRARSPSATARATCAHDAPRGLNAARNTGLARDRRGARLLRRRRRRGAPGLARRAAGARRRLPRRGRRPHRPDPRPLRGPPLPRPAGARAPPITFLDLGPADLDATHAWGANMARPPQRDRRASGRFDERARALRRRAGVAGALHAARRAHPLRRRRRARPPPRGRRRAPARRCAGAATRRGRASRALRRLQGHGARRWRASCACSPAAVLHGPRSRCANGPVLAAHTLGRARGGAARRRRRRGRRARTSSRAPAGTVGGKRGALLARAATRGSTCSRPRGARACAAPARRDAAAPARARARHRAPRRRSLDGRAAPSSRARATRVDVASREPRASAASSRTSTRCSPSTTLAAYDWLLVVDDDVALPRGFLDALPLRRRAPRPALAQPAHRLHSHAAWPVTRRRAGRRPRARRRFVEIGPVTAFHRDTLRRAAAVPRPAHGLGPRRALGARSPREHGWRIGVVDATPVGHTRARRPALPARRGGRARRARSSPTGPYVRRDEVPDAARCTA